MQLSKNLSLAEMTISESAKRNGISNAPTPVHLENLKRLAINVFQPIRDHFNIPIHISSGYRSTLLNLKIGGATASQHCLGQAMDIDMDGTSVTNAEIFHWIKSNLKFDQLIWEFGTDKNPDWVHVSYSSTSSQRNQVLKAIKRSNGKASYINFS